MRMSMLNKFYNFYKFYSYFLLALHHQLQKMYGENFTGFENLGLKLMGGNVRVGK